MTDELRPCPFCSEKELFLYEGVLYSYVKCQTCGTEGPSKYNEATEKAIKAWNKRARPDYSCAKCENKNVDCSYHCKMCGKDGDI